MTVPKIGNILIGALGRGEQNGRRGRSAASRRVSGSVVLRTRPGDGLTSEMADSVRASGVFKRYGASVALAGLNLTIPGGGVFGLLGPNGAGKTTFLRILMGLVRADAGEVIVPGSRGANRGAMAAG